MAVSTNGISLQAKLAIAYQSGTAANAITSASFDSLIDTTLGQFEHRSITCAASAAKTVIPTGTVTINDATKYYWVLIRNTSLVAAEIVYIASEQASTVYGVCGTLPGDVNGKGSFFLTRMVGTASTYPRLVFYCPSSAVPTIEVLVCDA